MNLFREFVVVGLLYEFVLCAWFVSLFIDFVLIGCSVNLFSEFVS